MDLSKPTETAFGREAESMRPVTHTVQSSPHKMPNLSSMEGLMGLNMAGILQAGLVHPVTGQIVNGSLRRDDSIMRRRRGRRRNVETLDLGLLKERDIHLTKAKVSMIIEMVIWIYVEQSNFWEGKRSNEPNSFFLRGSQRLSTTPLCPPLPLSLIAPPIPLLPPLPQSHWPWVLTERQPVKAWWNGSARTQATEWSFLLFQRSVTQI